MRVQIIAGHRTVLPSGLAIIVMVINGVEINLPADERLHDLIASLEDQTEPHWKSPDGELGVVLPTSGAKGQTGGVRVKLNDRKRQQLITLLKIALYERPPRLH